MKRSQLRKLIKEEILKESTPGFDTRNSGDPLPTLESVRADYESKNLKESDLSMEEVEEIDNFIEVLEAAITTARGIQNGDMDKVPMYLRMDFGSLVDDTRDALRGFE